MASQKCNAARAMGGRPAHSGGPGGSPSGPVWGVVTCASCPHCGQELSCAHSTAAWWWQCPGCAWHGVEEGQFSAWRVPELPRTPHGLLRLAGGAWYRLCQRGGVTLLAVEPAPERRKAPQATPAPVATPNALHGPSAASQGGIGGVAPDGDRSASPGAACYAGSAFENARPASRPEKQLCGQLANGYYLACGGKSFRLIMSSINYTSYEVNKPARPVRHVLQTLAAQGQKLRAMYRALGWSRADCAKFLHVTERCVHNWEAGRHAIPYAAYRLLRIHLGYSLPGKAWVGWRLCGGKLYTPEGHGLNPHDAKWWSMLARRAETGSQALRQLAYVKRLAGGADAASAAKPGDVAAPPASADPQGLRRAAPLDLSIGHFRTITQQNPASMRVGQEVRHG